MTLADQAQFALRAAVREVQRLVDDGMTEEQFELTRDFLYKYVLHFAETTQARLGYAIDDRFYDISAPGHLARFREVLPTLTLEEVNAAIRKHLQYDDLKIAIVTGEADALKTALAADAPSPMTYANSKPDEVLEEDKQIETYPLNIGEERIRIVPVEEMFQGR